MKYKVILTRTETYTHEQVVEAQDEDEALEIVENDETWSYPEECDYAEESNEIIKEG